MMSRNRNRKNAKKDRSSLEFWQSEAFNFLSYNCNLDMLLSLAVNRFRWVGLPDTCDARFLEMALHRNGMATICHSEATPDIWQSLYANPQSEFNEYGLPVKWFATGMNATQYTVTPQTGEIMYYSQTRMNPWNTIQMYAQKLMAIQRTEDVNLFHQHKPYVMVAPQEKRLELENIMKQVSGFEPMILGDKTLLELKENNVFAIDTKVPFIGEELAQQYQNVLNQFLMAIGVPHLAFEKGERMIEDEARANSAPTNLNLKNCLDARRYTCDRLRKLSPETFSDLYVYFNDDFESYNFNYMNNIESQAQDGLLEASVAIDEGGDTDE